MKLLIGKIYRGQGAAYIECVVKGVTDRFKVGFSVESETGVALPMASYKMDSDRYVIATPLLETAQVVILAEISDEKGATVFCRHKLLRRGQIKWASRFNYKLNAKDAIFYRDIEKFTFSNQIHINPLACHWMERGSEIIVKGVVCTPATDSKFLLELVDAYGVRVEEFNPYIGKPSLVNNDGVRRVETPFTVRVDKQSTCCLVARGKESRSAFMCFDKASRDYYRTVLEPDGFYALAKPGRWDEYYRGRMRKFEHADPRDYQVVGGPLFSVVVPLYNTPVELFREMVDSVTSQLYEKWELILVNSTPDNSALCQTIDQIADNRVRVIELAANSGISANTNVGVEAARGDYVVFFDHDDVLSPLALFRYAKKISECSDIDVLYCDEDNLSEDGLFCNPQFKSDFNIDLLRCHNYITHLLTVRTSLAKRFPLCSEYDGAQDYDLVLKLTEVTNKFAHIPEVLYHWRMSDTSTAKNASNKSYAQDAGIGALRAHLLRLDISATVEEMDVPFHYRTTYSIKGEPLVSVLIPNKDNPLMLSRCINSLVEKTDYTNIEVIVIENNSTDSETFKCYSDLERRYQCVRVVTWQDCFNYSQINNYGARFASGEYLLLLNNDVEVKNSSWLSSMLGICQRDDVGAVGAKLLYPDETVQHAGVCMAYCPNLTEMGGPVHIFNHLDGGDYGYMWRAVMTQDVSAVTGACLLTKRSVFHEVGGLSEEFAVAYNDIDYCLKVRDMGLNVVFDAGAVLYHYESLSRGSDKAPEKVNRFISEQGKLRAKWPEYYSEGDPYYSKYALGGW